MSFLEQEKIAYTAASLDDIPQIYSLCKLLIDTYEDVAQINYQKVLQWVEHKIRENIGEYTCVYLSGEKAGYFRLCSGEGQLELDDLYILPGFQNRGLGSAVVKKCILQANCRIFLYVFSRNVDAIRFYSRLGFAVAEQVSQTRLIMRYRG